MSEVTSSNEVTLHQFLPTPRIPNTSPPCMKLETYLRMTKIPFKIDNRFTMSKKGKMPWIEYKGQAVADSNFCIRFLNKEFNVDLNDHLSAEEKAIAHCVQTMLEENTYWIIVYYRWLDKDYQHIMKSRYFGDLAWPIRTAVFWKVQKSVRNQLYGHGIGRHSEEEMYGIGERDLRAVSEVLGEKEFMFGNKPCLLDAAVFALVASFALDTPPEFPLHKLVNSELQNLVRHAHRMKEAYYPDWDEVISKGI